MARTLHLTVALLIAAALVPAAALAGGPAATRAVLASQMRQAGGGSGAFAVDLDSGRTIFSSRAGTARTPASVEKLYTTSTALTLYGVNGHLTTRVLGDVGVDPAGVLIGNLYLRGGGDPYFDDLKAAQLADRLVLDHGLREITGRVIGDESAFDSLRGPPSEGFRTTNEVGPLSALTFNRGRTGAPRTYWQKRPPLFAARAFERALKRRDVVIGGAARTGRTQGGALPLTEQRSATMAAIARLTNRPSDNFNAETLIKALGEEFGAGGTTRAGAAVVRRTMTGFGLRPRVADGSGLSRSNRTTPRQVVRLLQHMAEDDEAGPAFQTSLAVAGRSGTLEHRMRRSVARDRCQAKTGTLNSVSALAGYCQTTSGARVAFAYLMTGVNVYGAHRLQDRMTSALARYSP